MQNHFLVEDSSYQDFLLRVTIHLTNIWGSTQLYQIRDALADLPSLAELDLSRNKLIADAMEGHIFDLPRLEALNLSSNKLSRLNRKG